MVLLWTLLRTGLNNLSTFLLPTTHHFIHCLNLLHALASDTAEQSQASYKITLAHGRSDRDSQHSPAWNNTYWVPLGLFFGSGPPQPPLDEFRQPALLGDYYLPSPYGLPTLPNTPPTWIPRPGSPIPPASLILGGGKYEKIIRDGMALHYLYFSVKKTYLNN